MIQTSNNTGKRSSEQTKSKENEPQQSFRASLKEELYFEIDIKRESRLISKWKKRVCFIIYLPCEELSLTIKLKDKTKEAEEIVNLRNTKISKRCSVVQNHHCFGMQIASGKRYLISRQTESKTLVLFDNITRLKRYFQEKSIQNQKPKDAASFQKPKEKIVVCKLEFERSNLQEAVEELEEKEEKKNVQLTNKESPIKLEYEKEEKSQKDIKIKMMPENGEIENENDDDYRTVMEDQPVPVFEEKPEIHLRVPLTREEISYLSSDEGFRLRQNFNEGRLLQKPQTYLKGNLMLKTHLNVFQLLQSFFHLELWNDKVVKYQILNRVDEGIYLVYLELKKKHFFAKNRYCYMMATSITFQTEPCLVLKSLNKHDFEPVQGCEWIDMTLWSKVRGSDEHHFLKFLTICLKIEDGVGLDYGNNFMSQIKLFQSFLYTTHSLPFKVLEWRKEENAFML